MGKKNRKKPRFYGRNDGIDRISRLPDDLLQNILSSLCIYDVVKSSVLSKRWRYIYTTTRYLNFDLARRAFPIKAINVVKVKEFIECVLNSNDTLVRFLLCCRSNDMFSSREVSLWMILAVTRRNVQELVLGFGGYEPFELRSCLATYESLQVLKLNLGRNVLKLPDHVGFPRLKFLHLENVKFSSEHLMNCLFSKSPCLESLILEGCDLGPMTLLDIASTSLIYVSLHFYEKKEKGIDKFEVKISCPNGKVLYYKGSMPKDIILCDLMSIQVVHIRSYSRPSEEAGIRVYKMIKGVPSTSHLELCIYSLMSLYARNRKVRLNPVCLYNLKSLNLSMKAETDFMQALMLLLKYSPNLEVLELQLCDKFLGLPLSDLGEYSGRKVKWQLNDPDESITCLESHLKSIRLTRFWGLEKEVILLMFLMKNARVLEELTVVWRESAYKSEEILKKVFEFPKTSSHVMTFLNPKPYEPSPYTWYDRNFKFNIT